MSQWTFPVPRTAVSGLKFPAVTDDRAAHLLALQFQLGQSEWWPPERLRAEQLRQQGEVLRHASSAVPYYRRRLAAAGYRAGQPVTEALLSQLPLLTRSDIQKAGAALHSAPAFTAHGQLSSGETSGSTGRPITFLSSAMEQLYWNAFTLREHVWHRRDFSAKLGGIRYTEKNGNASGWGPSTNHIFTTGPSAALRIDTPLPRQVEWLLKEKPGYLVSYASNIEALARDSLRRGWRPEGLREVRSVSETVRPELRSLVREAWGLRLVDMYSAKEAGYLALQCPDHDHYHVQEENVLPEVLDGQGRPCAPGETGRVVVTALHKFAMPLIRYDIGDYAIVGEPCSCGRGLGVIREILGRTRNMMRLPNGDQRWPLCDLVHQPDVPGVMQYQYIQKTLESIEVHLAVDAQFSRDREPRLTEIIHARLGHPFALTYVYHDSIPRSASGKFEDFRCEIAEA